MPKKRDPNRVRKGKPNSGSFKPGNPGHPGPVSYSQEALDRMRERRLERERRKLDDQAKVQEFASNYLDDALLAHLKIIKSKFSTDAAKLKASENIIRLAGADPGSILALVGDDTKPPVQTVALSEQDRAAIVARMKALDDDV